MNAQQTNSHNNTSEVVDTNNRRLENIFGEALGDKVDTNETQQAWQSFILRRRTARRRRIYWSVSGAAAAIILLFTLWPLHTTTSLQELEVFTSLEAPKEITFNETGKKVIVTTPPATITTIQLSDGTKVLLSANSRLEYLKDFTDTLRQVTLTGEARFEVAKDPLRPFIVNTEQLQTRVLGTIFNVKAYPQNYPDVTLYEGRVHVSSINRKQSREMKPGEQASLDKKGNLQLAKMAHPEKGWADGEFSFDNKILMQVMQEIGTWYNISVVFHSRPLLDERIYFRINRRLSVDEVLDALNDLRIALFEVKDGKIVVSAKRS